MNLVNVFLLLIVVVVFAFFVIYIINKNKNAEEETVNSEERVYTLNAMIDFIKYRIDEITKINLYDVGLSEEELKRRKARKYELRKALKGCTYGDVNDKKYVKDIIYDLLYREYGVNETKISRVIPFEVKSLLTAQDKFDIMLYIYKKKYMKL